MRQVHQMNSNGLRTLHYKLGGSYICTISVSESHTAPSVALRPEVFEFRVILAQLAHMWLKYDVAHCKIKSTQYTLMCYLYHKVQYLIPFCSMISRFRDRKMSKKIANAPQDLRMTLNTKGPNYPVVHEMLTPTPTPAHSCSFCLAVSHFRDKVPNLELLTTKSTLCAHTFWSCRSPYPSAPLPDILLLIIPVD